MRAFQGFRGARSVQSPVWTSGDSLFPFTCAWCHREFLQGGLRWMENKLGAVGHQGRVTCICDDCKQGHGPLRQKVPKLAERRTEL